MAFLSHTIPWASLASIFEYRPARSGPGPQGCDLFPKGKPGQVKQLEHFAVKFQDVVREHSAIERKRYRPAEAYAERAKTWVSASDRDGAGGDDAIDASQPATSDGQTRRPPRQSIADSENSWPTPEESRCVFPRDYTERYLPSVPITSGHAYGRAGLVEDFAQISTWIDLRTRQTIRFSSTRDEQNRIWLDERSCSDIIRLLIIDAATTEDANARTHAIETIFLLAHHPSIGLAPFIALGMDCCNINVGINRLPEKVLRAFLFLNILCALVDSDSSSSSPSRLTKPDDGLDYEGVSSLKTPYRRPEVFVTLLPRPVYMNTSSFYMIQNGGLDEHGHQVEHVFFTPLFAPRPSGGRRQNYSFTRDLAEDEKRHERDVLADRQALKANLKSMWKMLVYSDMLLQEVGRGPNWEYMVLSTLDEMFNNGKRLFGEYFLQYECRRVQAGDFRIGWAS